MIARLTVYDSEGQYAPCARSSDPIKAVSDWLTSGLLDGQEDLDENEASDSSAVQTQHLEDQTNNWRTTW